MRQLTIKIGLQKPKLYFLNFNFLVSYLNFLNTNSKTAENNIPTKLKVLLYIFFTTGLQEPVTCVWSAYSFASRETMNVKATSKKTQIVLHLSSDLQ